MPMMPFSGVRISWLAIARKRDLARLGGIGLVAGLGQRAFAFGAIGDVAADALHFRRPAGIVADEALAPRDPARAERAGDLLVVNRGCRSVRARCRPVRELSSVKRLPISASRGSLRQFAIGIVGDR